MIKYSKLIFSLMVMTFCGWQLAAQGRVGINTNNPQAMLHVGFASVLFTGDNVGTPGNLPISGPGGRMMWYANKSAFRAGLVAGNQWDDANIGKQSIALGLNPMASGEASIAIGASSAATGNYSLALGPGATAKGGFSVAIGDNVEAIGSSSFASGFNTIGLGRFTSAFGYISQASGELSTTMGLRTVARSFASLAIGRLNDSIISSNPDTWVSTDPAFIIGNGTDNNARRNAFLIAKNGETGINVANGMPQAMLHIKARQISDNRHIRLEDDNTPASANIFYTSDLVFKNNLAGGDFIFRNDANANIFSLFSSGNLTIAGTLTQNSDARLKTDIQPIENGLQKILLIGGYHYNWKEGFRDQRLQTGLLAQQVEQQMPELVETDVDGQKSVNYSGMIPYTIEAIKELKKENDELRSELRELKQLIKQSFPKNEQN